MPKKSAPPAPYGNRTDMACYPDLSTYDYAFQDSDRIPVTAPPLLNVGWLGRSREYPHGETDDQFRKRLGEFCAAEPEVVTAGLHTCELCAKAQGSGEIRVVGRGRIYAAPVLIHHYVVGHDYRPPDEFIQAVMSAPLLGSHAYQKGIRFKIVGSKSWRESEGVFAKYHPADFRKDDGTPRD